MRRSRRIRDELAEQTEHGELYVRRLMRAQLTLSLSALIAFGGLIGSLPLALYLLPGLQRVQPLGVPLPLLVLTVPPFVGFVALAWIYERRAVALEQAFRELVDDA